MFRIVYVLVSSGTDNYYKQLIISLRTLRYRMKKISVVVLTDNDTYNSLKKIKNAEIFQLAKVKGVVIDGPYSPKEKSRYLKTTLRNILDGDLLFIDCDTVICADFSTYSFEASLALVDDENIAWKDHLDKERIVKDNLKLHFDPSAYKNYFNSGVMWIRDMPETRLFFNYWHECWKNELQFGNCLDQPPLNYVNENIMPLISKLSVIWNCQVSSNPSGVQYLSDAYIIHYFNFNSGPYLLANRDFVMNNFNKSVMDNIIENPKSAFMEAYIAPYNDKLGLFLNTRTFRGTFYFYKNCKFGWHVLEICLKILYMIKHIWNKK